MRIRHETFREKDSQSAGSARLRCLRPIPETVHPVFSLQQQAGNQAVQHLLRTGLIQAKLAISSPGDPQEVEADRVADHVMRAHAGAPAAAPCTCPGGGEMCEECQQKQHGVVAHYAESAGDVNEIPSAVHEILRSPGQPLDRSTRAFFEARFGHDFSHVRIHTDLAAGESAQAINAHAFTAGSHLVFAPGKYNPRGSDGRQLLAHELAHVVQQSARRDNAFHGIQQLQRQPKASSGLAAPDPKAFANADPEAAALLRGVISSGGARTIPTGVPLTAGPLPNNGGSVTITFSVDPTLPAAGITRVAGVSGLGTPAGIIAIAMFFNSTAPTQQTWFHEFQHVLILISKELLKNAAQTQGSTASNFTPAMTAAMTSSRTASRYWADLNAASTLPESQAVVNDYKTIVGAARTAASGSTVVALSDSDVIEHAINERRAKLEEQAFVVANKRGNPSSAMMPAFIADELIVPLKAQMTPAQQSTFNASLSGLGLQANLEASLTRLFAKLPTMP